jgi:hypothetical protein
MDGEAVKASPGKCEEMSDILYIEQSPLSCDLRECKFQRRGTFYNLQTTNVKRRWNSTLLMLRRAKRLRVIFSLFNTEYDCEEMLLSEQEWRQIDYLLCITEAFFDYTTQLSKTRDVIAYYYSRSITDCLINLSDHRHSYATSASRGRNRC